MNEQGQNQAMLPAQVIEKPVSVTVFGVLNVIFGGLGLLCTPFVSIIGLATMRERMEPAMVYMVWNVVAAVIGFGFSIWLLTLGIGLLMFKSWARRGSVIYAYIMIAWALLVTMVNIAAVSLRWITVTESEMVGYIGGTCGGLCGGLVYPILLLIFMQTTKVKQAFAAIGG